MIEQLRTTSFLRLLSAAAATLVLASLVLESTVLADEKVTYDKHLVPILRQRCGACHSPTSRKGDLDVTTYFGLMQGGGSGAVIEPGDPDGSYLYSLVTHEAEPFMPQNADKIPDGEIEILRRWIEGGALENDNSQAKKPKARKLAAVEVAPGAKPDVIPLPPRMVLEPSFPTQHAPMARSLATSPWAPLVAIAGQRQVLLYDTKTLELVGVFPFPEGQPNVVRFSSDGALLLAGGGHPAASGKVVVWDVATGERVFEVGDELDAVLAADISADHSQVALGGPQRVVRVYSTETGDLLYELNKHTDWVLDVEFSPDGVLLATADRSSGLYLWEARTGHEYLTLNGHTGAVTSLSWRSDSTLLASGSEDGTVRLWEPENGTQVKNWNAQAAVLSLEFARDGRLVTGGRDQIARLWDAEGKQLAASAALGDVVVSASYCDETNRIIAGNWNGAVHTYEAANAADAGELLTNPPTLDARLQAARQLAQETSAASQPLVEARTKAMAEVTAAQTALASAKAEAEKLHKEADDLSTQANQLNQARTENDAERSQSATTLENIRGALPLLSETLRQLTEASAKLTNDATIAEISRQLTEKLQSLDAQSAELQTKMTQLTETIDSLDAQVKDLGVRVEAAGQQSKAADERLAAAQTQADSLATAADAARQAAEAAETQSAEAQRQVERWQGEIAFRDQIAAFEEKLKQAQQVAVEREADLDRANTEMAGAQKKVDDAKAANNDAARAITQIRDEIAHARGK
ncbi:MAG: c-type cytochrome domain-containing protein [Pirellulales bacterium]